MKITKARLKQVIKEELAGVLYEVDPHGAFGLDLGILDAAGKKVGEWWSGPEKASEKEQTMTKLDAPKGGGPAWYPHKGGGKEEKKSLSGLAGSFSPAWEWYRTGEAEGSIYPGQATRDYIMGDEHIFSDAPEEGYEGVGDFVGDAAGRAKTTMGIPMRGAKALRARLGEPLGYAAGLAAQEMAADTAEDYIVGEPGSQREAWNEWRQGTNERQSEAGLSGVAKLVMAAFPGGRGRHGQAISKAQEIGGQVSSIEKIVGAEGGMKGKLETAGKEGVEQLAGEAPPVGIAMEIYKMMNSREDSKGQNAKEGTPQKVSYDIKSLTIRNKGPLMKKQIGGQLLSDLSRNPEVTAVAYAMGMIEDDALEHILRLSKEGLSGQALAAAREKKRQQMRPGVWDTKTNRMVAYDDSVEKREKTRIAQQRAIRKGGEQVALKEEIDRVLYASIVKGNW